MSGSEKFDSHVSVGTLIGSQGGVEEHTPALRVKWWTRERLGTKKKLSVFHGIRHPLQTGRPIFNWDSFFVERRARGLLGKKKKKKKRATAQRAGAKISSQYNSGHFQHCLFAIHFFLCPVERHEENFQAASARATKRDNLCLCGAENSRREGTKGRRSNAPKCFLWHWSVFST